MIPFPKGNNLTLAGVLRKLAVENCMTEYTRRSVIKAGLAASAGALTGAGAVAHAEGFPEPSGGFNAQEAAASGGPASSRQRLLLDFGWRFHFGDAAEQAHDFGYGAPSREGTFAKASFVAEVGEEDFDDSSWRVLDLPHDWAVELPFITSGATYMEGSEPKLVNYSEGRKPIGRDFPATSVGWYRRKIVLPAGSEGKRVHLEFDGVFRDAIVLFNNHYLGRNFSGYAPFSFDITDYLVPGKPNQLTMRVDATLSEGWFYEGTGIYRHVWLTIADPLHVSQWGNFVTAIPGAAGTQVRVETEVANHSDQPKNVSVSTVITDPSGASVLTVRSEPRTIDPWESAAMLSQGILRSPALWSCEQPHLYRAITAVQAGTAITDQVETSFGIRTIRFDADRGFFLNEKPVKIKGTCNHQDHAGVGSAIPDQLQQDRVALLKASGSNACRTSHNPPAPEFLDACDRLGMLVMDETRMMASTPEGLSQLERLVKRDRNHPSIILWSLANEEPDQSSQVGAHIVASMKRTARRLDPTRPVTAAMNGGWGRGVSHVVDVQGFNYAGAGGGGGAETGRNIDAFHHKFPAMPTIGTETASVWTTRGIYKKDPAKAFATGYDIDYPGYTLSAEGWWSVYDAREYLAGGFAWTGFDYRGEPSPFDDAGISSPMGMLDLCGFPKDSYFFYRSWWQAEPVVHLFPHWDWAGQEGQNIDVWCYANLDEIELFVNGKSAGRQAMPRNGHVQWKVPYHPGRIEARGSRGGKVVLSSIRETTGPAAKLRLTPNRPAMRANREDLVSVQVEALDSKGRSVPIAANLVRFKLQGAGRLVGFGNGDPSCREADKPETAQSGSRSLFCGLAMAYVQALDQSGEVVLQATADGLAPATLTLVSQAATARPRLT